MKFGKKSLSLLLAASMMAVTLGGCLKDSSQQSATVQVDYNAEEEVAKYRDHLGELSEADKNYVVQMGYNNCDHMVASLVGEGSGIFDALGLNVNITKTGQIMQAMASGEMDVGYQGIGGEPWKSPQWCSWAEELGIPVMPEGNYEAVDMSATDALIAMKAGQVDGFST